MIHIDKSFYEDETREGFFVESKMKRYWAAQIEVLEEIRRICNKHNIPFWAEWGSLLGAVRHQGFIPWDDDLDIGMLRDDWFRFMEIAPNELGEWFELKNIYNDVTQDNCIARVITGRHMNFDEDYLERFHYCPFSVGIDIFPIDYIPREDVKKEQLIDLVHLLMTTAHSLSCEPPYTKDDYEIAAKIEELTGLKVNWENRLFHEIKKMVDIVSSTYGPDDGDEVCSMMRLQRGQDYHVPKESYSRAIEMPFEYTTIPVPVGYDEILKLKYGDDYMTPKNIGGGHEYPVYKEQEEALKDVLEREFQTKLTMEQVQALIHMKVFGEGSNQ